MATVQESNLPYRATHSPRVLTESNRRVEQLPCVCSVSALYHALRITHKLRFVPIRCPNFVPLVSTYRQPVRIGGHEKTRTSDPHHVKMGRTKTILRLFQWLYRATQHHGPPDNALSSCRMNEPLSLESISDRVRLSCTGMLIAP